MDAPPLLMRLLRDLRRMMTGCLSADEQLDRIHLLHFVDSAL